MNGNHYRLVLVLVAGCLVFQGCETVRGVRKDVDNTVVNIKNLPHKAAQADDWFQKNFW